MEKKSVEEKNYIQGIISGDRVLIKEVYEKYHKAILHLVEKDRGNEEDAQDVFQEGLMLVYQKAQQKDFQLSSSFFTYFYAICRNIWWNKRRKKSNTEITLTEEMQSMVVDTTIPAIEKNEQLMLFRKKLLLLGQDCQELLRLFLQKVKMEEIKKRMNYSSVNYVKQRKFKCKAQLIKLIEQDPAYQELTN